MNATETAAPLFNLIVVNRANPVAHAAGDDLLPVCGAKIRKNVVQQLVAVNIPSLYAGAKHNCPGCVAVVGER